MCYNPYYEVQYGICWIVQHYKILYQLTTLMLKKTLA